MYLAKRMKWFVVAACLLVAVSCLPVLDVRGFAWAENLVFDGQGNLFVSDTTTGILYRIYLSADKLSYRKDEHVAAGSFNKINGLAISADGSTVYAVAELTSDKNPYLVSIPTTITNTFTPLIQTPRLGNGLAFNPTANVFYTTNEGDFIPGNGIVYLIDLNANTTSTADSIIEGADGCTIDLVNNRLYITEVLKGDVIQYEIRSDNSLRRQNNFNVPGIGKLDDITLSADGTQLYGADYGNGTISVFNADGSSTAPVILMDSLVNPTAVKFATGPDFNSTTVFVTEGGGFFAFRRDRKVLQSPYALGIATF